MQRAVQASQRHVVASVERRTEHVIAIALVIIPRANRRKVLPYSPKIEALGLCTLGATMGFGVVLFGREARATALRIRLASALFDEA